jgi:hypothetical protein
MTDQIRKATISLISDFIIFGGYYLIVYSRYQSGGLFTTEQEFKFWASAILIFIPVIIISKILFYILYAIVKAIATQEKDRMISDELDKLIELKASKYSSTAFSMGFMLGMVALLLGWPTLVMFNIFLLSMFACMLVDDLSQLILYRRLV